MTKTFTALEAAVRQRCAMVVGCSVTVLPEDWAQLKHLTSGYDKDVAQQCDQFIRANAWTVGTSEHRPPGWEEHTRGARTARNYYSSNGVIIEATRSINGSGPQAFGGAEEWPAVTVRISLPEGRNDLRALLVEEMKTTIDRFLEKHGLDKEVP